MIVWRRLVNGELEDSDARQVRFDEDADVVVAGVGTAGAIAVIAASAQGASVLGVDRLPGIGGMGTMGYVSGYYYGLAGGLQTDIDAEAQQMGREHFLDRVEAKKYVLENQMTAHGARLSLETRITGVFLEGAAVKGVSLLRHGKQWNVSCRVVIDATADAAVCLMAGCPTRLGRESDGQTRPFTSVKVWLNQNGNITRTNHDSGYMNQYDPFELSQGILQAHASQMLEEFSDEAKRVLFLAPFIGIREGRIIEAEKNITMRDVLAQQPEPEPLFYAYSDFDKHGKDHALETEELQDLYVAANLSTSVFSVPVSIHSMIPRGYQGILAAGRHLGMDHDVASAVRMQRDMQKCGESAGIYAALAAKLGVAPAAVPYETVKGLLEASGCLTEEHNKGIVFDDAFRREKIEWLTEPEAIKAALSTDMPGVAIYSCKLLGEKITPALKAWLSEDDVMLRTGSALGLGIAGDAAALPVLRDIVNKRDAFYFKDCRRTNQFRSVIAIYLLGKLGDQESIPVLRDILCKESEYDLPLYHEIKETSYKLNSNKNFNELYYQIVSQAALALIRIARAHAGQAETIKQALREAFKDDRHIRNTTTLPAKTFEYETGENLRSYVLAFCGEKSLVSA